MLFWLFAGTRNLVLDSPTDRVRAGGAGSRPAGLRPWTLRTALRHAAERIPVSVRRVAGYPAWRLRWPERDGTVTAGLPW